MTEIEAEKSDLHLLLKGKKEKNNEYEKAN